MNSYKHDNTKTDLANEGVQIIGKLDVALARRGIVAVLFEYGAGNQEGYGLLVHLVANGLQLGGIGILAHHLDHFFLGQLFQKVLD